MCLGVPGEVVEIVDPIQQLARVDVAGVRRVVNIRLVADEGLSPGDWVLIHVGFAMAKINQEEAALALASLRMMGRDYDDEVRALAASEIEAMLGASNDGEGG